MTTLAIDRFVMEWDGSRNWTLSEKSIATTERKGRDGEVLPAGREVVSFVGYYSTLEQALQSCLQLRINNSDADTARGIIAEINEARRAIVAASRHITVANVPKERIVQ